MRHTDEMSTVLGQAVLGALQCVDGNLLSPRKSRSRMSAWDAVVGRIPTLWANEALRAGLELKDQRWYGALIRKPFWWHLLKARREQRKH